MRRLGCGVFRRGRTDANQTEIVEALRKLGVSVAITSAVGKGFPDLVCGYRGKTYLIEVKTDDKKKLTDDQKAFYGAWRGQWARVSNSVEAWEVVSEG